MNTYGAKFTFVSFLVMVISCFGFISNIAVTHPNVNTTSAVDIDPDFANDIINSSIRINVEIFGKTSRTGSGSIIFQKPIFDEHGDIDYYRLVILTAAHLLTSGAKYSMDGTICNEGHVDHGYHAPCAVTEYVDKENDLCLFEAKAPYKLKCSNKDLNIFSDNVFLRRVLMASYPKSVGPILADGIITNQSNFTTLCNIVGTYGSSGAVVYDMQTRKIIGVYSIILTPENNIAIEGVAGLINNDKIQTFISKSKKAFE